MSQHHEHPIRLRGPTHWLISHAAHRAPDALASRLEEEWLADLESRSSALSRLRFALGCCWATMVIVKDYPRTRVAATTSAAATRGFIALTDRSFGYFSVRSGTIFLVAGLHAALFYGLITTLSHTRGAVAPADLQNQALRPVQPDKFLPPPPPPIKMADAPKLIVDAPPGIEIEPDLIPTQVVDKSPDTVETPPVGEAPTLVRRVAGGPGAGFPDTADFYPSLSIHLGEEGMSTVRVCVDSKGALTSNPATVRSSGNTRLDEAALKLALAGSGHYRATTEDGRPVDSCYPLGIRFQLKK
jgi:TonB family protein